MNISNTRKPKEKYKQYIFHLDYPIDSIDVREINENQLCWLLDLYHDGSNTIYYTDLNYKQAKRILTEFYPELLL